MDEFDDVLLINETEWNKLQNLSSTAFNGADTVNMARVKLGEVFQISTKCYEFVCIHCSKEFQIFSEFIVHVEAHLRSFAQELTRPAEVIRNETIQNQIIRSETVDNETRIDFKVNDGNHQQEDDMNSFLDKYNCSDMDSDGSTKKNVDNVLNTQSDNKRIRNFFVCSICKQRFTDDGNFKEHFMSHVKKETTIKCLFCEQKFRHSRFLRRHVLVQHQKSNQNEFEQIHSHVIFECYICKKRIYGRTLDEKKFNLCFHLEITHNNKKFRQVDKLFQCTICGKYFRSDKYVREHIAIHEHTEKNLKCPFCDQKFTLASYVRRHITKWHGQRYTNKMVRAAQT